MQNSHHLCSIEAGMSCPQTETLKTLLSTEQVVKGPWGLTDVPSGALEEQGGKLKTKSSTSTKKADQGCLLWGRQGHRGLGIHEEIIIKVPGKVSSPVQM